MKRLLLFIISEFVMITASLAQESKLISIETCYSLARQQYPLIKQKELIEKSTEFSLENASKGYLPQLNLNGQATYQSDITKLPITIPNVKIPSPDKDQYKFYGELNQPLSDAIIIGKQKELIESNALIENQKLEVELYKLKERINQLFFGILLIDDQLVLTEIFKKDIKEGIAKLNAAITNGIAIKSNADVLKAELLKAEQRSIELRASRESFIEMLGMFLNQKFDGNVKLEKPKQKTISESIQRPELTLFDNQKKTVAIQNKLISAKSLPRANIFIQSGFGKPAFNMFSNDFDFFYIGGIRFSWQFSNYYTMKKDRMLLTINQNMFDIQKETFLFNTNVLLKQQNGEIKKLAELIEKDNEIISLRKSIKESAGVQLENGIISPTDYLREVNAEDQAKQGLLMHQTQFLAAQYNYQTTSGN